MIEVNEFKIKITKSKFLFKLNHNLWVQVDFEKYRTEAIAAVGNNLKQGVYEKKIEDETGTQGLWDLANEIVSNELGYLEYMVAQQGDSESLSIEDFNLLAEDVYDELKKYARQEVINLLKNQIKECKWVQYTKE